MRSYKQIGLKNIKRILKSCLQLGKEDSGTEEKVAHARGHMMEVLEQLTIFSSEKDDLEGNILDSKGISERKQLSEVVLISSQEGWEIVLTGSAKEQ